MPFIPSSTSILALLATATYAASNYKCTNIMAHVSIVANTKAINLSTPANQMEVTGIVTEISTPGSNYTTDIVGSTTKLTATYDIYTEICVPNNYTSRGILEFAVHGANYDHRYWSFGGKGSQYNYVEAAIRAGHAIFTYDRLGVGLSSTPDGIQEVQSATEIQIAATLLQTLKRGWQGYTFDKIVGLGFSFGSSQLLEVAAQYGNLFDACVLTGIAAPIPSSPTVFAAYGLEIAAEKDPGRFGSLSLDYLVIGSLVQAQQTQFYFPYFDDSVLKAYDGIKAPVTLGTIFTVFPVSVAQNYTNPVFVVTGEKDYRACIGNCYQPYPSDESYNIVTAAQTLFPQASNFSVYLPLNTGHALNLHYNSQHTFNTIQSWDFQCFVIYTITFITIVFR